MGNLVNGFATLPVNEQDATKVATYNLALQMLDDMIAGKQDISTTGGTTTLFGTPANPQAQHLFLNVTGALVSNSIIEIPVAAGTGRNRIYIVKNGTSGASTVTVRAVGGTGVQVSQGYTAILLYNGTDIAYAGPQVNSTTGLLLLTNTTISARVFHSTTQSIADSTNVALNFDSERSDTDTIHDNVTNNSRLTCKTAGLYDISVSVGFAANGTGARGVYIRLNGSSYIAGELIPAVAGGTLITLISFSTKTPLIVNDYAEAIVFQSSGGSLNTAQISAYTPEFMMTRLGA